MYAHMKEIIKNVLMPYGADFWRNILLFYIFVKLLSRKEFVPKLFHL